MSAEADGRPVRGQGKGFSLLDCTRAPGGNMSAKADGRPVRKQGTGFHLLDCAGPAYGNLPSRRHAGCAADSGEMHSSARFWKKQSLRFPLKTERSIPNERKDYRHFI